MSEREPDVDAGEFQRPQQGVRPWHFVGVDPVTEMVGHPHGAPVGPKALGTPVARASQRVELQVPLAGPSGQVIGIDLVVGIGDHPHGHAVRPQASSVLVARTAKITDVAAGPADPGDQVIGVDLVVGVVADPHRHAVRPQARGITVAGSRQGVDFAEVPTDAAGQVVGKDLVVGIVDHPDGDAVRPHAARGPIESIQPQRRSGLSGEGQSACPRASAASMLTIGVKTATNIARMSPTQIGLPPERILRLA